METVYSKELGMSEEDIKDIEEGRILLSINFKWLKPNLNSLCRISADMGTTDVLAQLAEDGSIDLKELQNKIADELDHALKNVGNMLQDVVTASVVSDKNLLKKKLSEISSALSGGGQRIYSNSLMI